MSEVEQLYRDLESLKRYYEGVKDGVRQYAYFMMGSWYVGNGILLEAAMDSVERDFLAAKIRLENAIIDLEDAIKEAEPHLDDEPEKERLYQERAE